MMTNTHVMSYISRKKNNCDQHHTIPTGPQLYFHPSVPFSAPEQGHGGGRLLEPIPADLRAEGGPHTEPVAGLSRGTHRDVHNSHCQASVPRHHQWLNFRLCCCQCVMCNISCFRWRRRQCTWRLGTMVKTKSSGRKSSHTVRREVQKKKKKKHD